MKGNLHVLASFEQEMKQKELVMQSLKKNFDEEKQKREKLEVDIAHLKTCLRNQLLLIEQVIAVIAYPFSLTIWYWDS